MRRTNRILYLRVFENCFSTANQLHDRHLHLQRKEPHTNKWRDTADEMKPGQNLFSGNDDEYSTNTK